MATIDVCVVCGWVFTRLRHLHSLLFCLLCFVVGSALLHMGTRKGGRLRIDGDHLSATTAHHQDTLQSLR